VAVTAEADFISDPRRRPRDSSFELGGVAVEAELIPDSRRAPADSFSKAGLVLTRDGFNSVPGLLCSSTGNDTSCSVAAGVVETPSSFATI